MIPSAARPTLAPRIVDARAAVYAAGHNHANVAAVTIA